VPTAVHLRRLAALAVASSLFVSAPAMAQTGGAESQPAQQTTTAPAKKPTTKQIQKALGIKADGVFGPKTKRAVKTYQRRNGLKVTGKADTATLRSLGLVGQPQTSGLDSVAAIPADAKAILDQLAQCESGGNIAAESRDGRYFGKYQFSIATWEAMGGTGSPAEAPEATQDALAYKLYQQRGTAPWPSCSAQLDLEDA
jgi:peptidoglycan hydrolase-like protein with peptidoglycan-binding domain